MHIFHPDRNVQSEDFQEDIYPMTASNEAAMTAQEWLMGQNKGEFSVVSLQTSENALLTHNNLFHTFTACKAWSPF